MAEPVKKPWQSKTLWVNGIAAVAIALQMITGKVVLDTEAQVGLLALVNVVLRLVTSSAVGLRDD